MIEFEFVDIPIEALRDQRSAIYFEFADALRARPRQFAKWPRPLKHPRPLMSGINSQNGKCPKALLGDKRFEACVYEGVLCVRWNGDHA